MTRLQWVLISRDNESSPSEVVRGLENDEYFNHDVKRLVSNARGDAEPSKRRQIHGRSDQLNGWVEA